MTQLHHRSLPQWDALGGGHTAREIAQQPAVWRQLPQCWDAVPAQERQRISALLANPHVRVAYLGV